MTVNEYVEKVFYHVGRGVPESQAGIYRSAIKAELDNSLMDLADMAADDVEPRRAWLQKSFPFTLTAGASPTVSLTSTIMMRTVPKTGYVTLAGVTEPLAYMPYRYDLDNPPPITGLYFYSIFENTFVVRDATGAAPAGTPTLTVHASFVPVISEVPDDLNDDLVNIGVARATELKYTLAKATGAD